MVALLLALLLPITASAQIRTATASEKTIILGEIALGLNAAENLANSQAEVRVAKLKGDLAAFEVLMVDALKQESAMHDHLNRAIRLTGSSYQTGPESGDVAVKIINGPLQGNAPKYSPVFYPDTMGVIREVEDGEGKKHYLRFEPKIAQAGGTWEDGMVMVRLQTFKDARKDGNPGVLAALLQHEAVHFNALVKQGWYTTEENERQAYEDGIKTAAIFELSKMRIDFFEQKKTEHARRIWLNKNIPLGPSLHSPFPNAAQEEENRRAYELEQTRKSEFELDKEKLKEIQETRHAAQAAADKDHDERLRNTYLDIARRSCANPGSVNQAELDGLPKPYDKSSMALKDGELSGSCGMVYLMLVAGVNAEELRRQSTPIQLAAPVQALQPTPYIPVTYKIPFSSVLPGLKNYSVRACGSNDEVPVDATLTDPREHFAFMKDLDDRTANKLAAGLGDCERRLFRELIRVIRNGEGRLISSGWVKETVAGYRPPPDTSSGNYTPPTSHGNRGEGSGNSNKPPCEYINGVRACPDDRLSR